MSKLAEVVRRYLRAQIDAGADCIQLFDSWVGQLSADDYRTYVQTHVQHILKDISGKGVPVIHFGTGTYHLLEAQREAGGDVIGLDFRTPLDEGWKRVGYDHAVQGNLDPILLFVDPKIAQKQAQKILDQAQNRNGHIFNLGHGILPETPVDNVKRMIDFVHEKSTRK
jgi:uroporphyrinogen decarboxylase